ncbi:hypothetical protein HELRODRAFT_170349 [Helobdella robusta]|uniref:Uncharacterized protein n=1 Tax=Helobdella robusta TaxID=6412 RepID=T1F2Y6_HELRO|nr:hypothetical protein HELRODRAFT_170349 [Helobdella robusta]ESO07795.1 hypothetical protein HELRODRAFT_170349 [Helobdella robusta]
MKKKKYGNALPSMEFLPICIEVLGPMDPNTLKILKAICKMISVRSGDSRELFFATNHISCLLQRFLRVYVLENIKLNADIEKEKNREERKMKKERETESKISEMRYEDEYSG